MTSKRQLRADLQRAQADSNALAHAIFRHVDAAENLGHEAPSPMSWPWQSLADRALASLELLRLADVNELQADIADLRANLAAAQEAAATEAKVEATPTPKYYGSVVFDGERLHFGTDFAACEKSEVQVRRETLEKVIEALELDEYRGYPNGYPIVRFFGQKEEPNADRFWADITTALRVRAEDAEAEADEAAEARIAAITRPAPEADEVYSAGETILSGDENGIDR